MTAGSRSSGPYLCRQRPLYLKTGVVDFSAEPMTTRFSPRTGALAAALLLLAGGSPAVAQARRPAPRRAAPRKPVSPKVAVPKPAGALSHANLGALLRSLGYRPEMAQQYQRIRVEEEGYGYLVDLSLSKSGDWLVCMAHLAPIPDLTRVPASPLLTLLSTNDSLLGMYFSYDRVNARIMLNATVPNRSLDAASVRNIVEGLKATVRQTQALWDTASWEPAG
jgi:hypothetical protein